MIAAGERLRRLVLALCLAYGAALAAESSAAAGVPSASSNFTPPSYVPNYFSNETAPFRGSSGGQVASPGTAPVAAVPHAAERRSVVPSHYVAQRHFEHSGRRPARWARGTAARYTHHPATRARVFRSSHGSSARTKAVASARRTAPAKVHGGKNRSRAQRVARARD